MNSVEMILRCMQLSEPGESCLPGQTETPEDQEWMREKERQKVLPEEPMGYPVEVVSA